MDRDWTHLGILAAAAIATSAALVPGVRRLARRVGAVDVPDERRVHAEPTARLGGVAVFLAFTIVLCIGRAVGWVNLSTPAPNILAFMIGATLVVTVGAVDDARRLGPLVKLAVEIVAAAIVVYGGGCQITGLSSPGGGFLDLGTLSAPFSILWIVLVTNALNLIDGIDGLAAGTAAIAMMAVALIARGFGFATVAQLAVVLGGACLGFLLFNFHPASIFLGDSGSLFIGFGIAVLSSYARAKGTTGAITLATLLIVALPLGDTFTAMTRRYFNGLLPGSPRSHLAGVVRMFQADRNHLHHRLLAAGFGQRAATYFLYGIQAIACAYAVYLLIRG
jgi:UDP-GlcNAc:undecaprenyl-phosphate GlcNAc-1-phosphate transferase